MIPLLTGIIASSRKGINSTPFTVYTTCYSGSPITVYTSIEDGFSTGSVIYSDAGLTTPYINQNFTYNFTRYSTDNSGILAANSSCPTQYTVYNECDLINVRSVLYTSNETMDIGTTLYTDENFISTYNFETFYYGSPAYQFTTGSLGAVVSKAICNRSWIKYANCLDYRNGTDPVTFYTAFADAVIQIGVTLYADANLTTQLSNATFTHNSYEYTTDGSGVINYVSTSSCPYFVPYANICGAANIGYLYSNSPDTSLAGIYANLTPLYTDSGLSSPFSGDFYQAGSSNYIYVSNGTIISLNACPT